MGLLSAQTEDNPCHSTTHTDQGPGRSLIHPGTRQNPYPPEILVTGLPTTYSTVDPTAATGPSSKLLDWEPRDNTIRLGIQQKKYYAPSKAQILMHDYTNYEIRQTRKLIKIQ